MFIFIFGSILGWVCIIGMFCWIERDMQRMFENRSLQFRMIPYACIVGMLTGLGLAFHAIGGM
jgi:hypothetical protein